MNWRRAHTIQGITRLRHVLLHSLKIICVQFLGYPLGSAEMLTKAAVMVNLLGKHNAPLDLASLPDALRATRAKVHIYGKSQSRIGRKMGHVTVVGESIEECLQHAMCAAKAIQI